MVLYYTDPIYGIHILYHNNTDYSLCRVCVFALFCAAALLCWCQLWCRLFFILFIFLKIVILNKIIIFYIFLIKIL